MPISLKAVMSSGGGGVPIGGITQLAIQPASPLAEVDGKVYLQSGYVLRGETLNYPEAAALLVPNYSELVVITNTVTQTLGNAYAIAFGAGTFVVLGQTAAVSITSTDGITWVSRAATGLPVSSAGQLTFGAGKFVAASGHYSADAITWTAGGLPLGKLRYLNTLFLSYSAGSIKTSTDGVTWSALISPAGITSLSRAAFGNGKYVICGGVGKVVWSSDGITWNVVTTPSVADFVSVDFGAGYFVAATATELYRSADGITWSLVSTNTAAPFYYIQFADGLFFTSTRGTGDFVLVSKDGLSWFTPSTLIGVRLGRDACYSSTKRALVYAAETAYVHTIYTDQMGIPTVSYFGGTPGAGATGSIKSNALDYLRIA